MVWPWVFNGSVSGQYAEGIDGIRVHVEVQLILGRSLGQASDDLHQLIDSPGWRDERLHSIVTSPGKRLLYTRMHKAVKILSVNMNSALDRWSSNLYSRDLLRKRRIVARETEFNSVKKEKQAARKIDLEVRMLKAPVIF